MNEDYEQQEKDKDNILRLGGPIEHMCSTEGWSMFHAIGSSQMAMHQEKLLDGGSPRDMDQFRKGIIYGIRTLLKTPEAILAERKSILKERESLIEPQTTVTESPDESEGEYASAKEDRPHGE